jgi:membrane protease YdiL (CAAX protease family)
MAPALLWSLLPGGGHFYLGNTGTGITYATLTGAFFALGAEVQRRNEELDREDDELNVPFVVGEKIWEYSIFTTFRESARRTGLDLRRARFDDTPTSELLLAPFDPDQFLRLPVFGAALLGVAGAALAHDHDGGRLPDVTRAQMLGDTYDRDDATALYMGSALLVSLGAGAAEEGLFRGVVQTLLQDRWGNAGGLWAASGIFGAAHLGGDGLNVDGALFATAAGAYLGWLYNHDDNRLAGPIAAHFWYDFMIFAASWALDPDDTPFGFQVEYEFQP